MFIDMLDVARKMKPDLSSVHTGIMAGASCPEELCWWAFIFDFDHLVDEFMFSDVVNELNMKDFVVAYGMTETSPVTFQVRSNDTVIE